MKSVLSWSYPVLIMMCCVVLLYGAWAIRFLPIFFMSASLTFIIMALLAWGAKEAVSLTIAVVLILVSAFLSFRVFEYDHLMFSGCLGGLVSGSLFGRNAREGKRAE